jgi:heat shock protein HslJ
MKLLLCIPLFFFLCVADAHAQKSKKKKDKFPENGPKVFETIGDSLRKDSVVYYETEIGYIMPDLSQKFKGRWAINVMRKQARAVPDTLSDGYIEFNEDTLFTAYVGCNKLSGKYIIKGPTIKLTILDTSLATCEGEIEQTFIKLIQDRVSYFGIDEKLLYLKDVAFNIVFDCSRKKEEDLSGKSSYK